MIDFKRFSLAFVACLSLFCVAKLCGQWWNQDEGRRMLRPGSLLTGGSGSNILLSDTFTDSNGTLLTAHTMDKGPGWSTAGGLWGASPKIASNQATGNANDYNGCVADAGAGNATLTGDLTWSSGDSQFYVIGRWNDGNNYWEVVYDGTNTWTIYDTVGGVSTTVNGTYALSNGVTYNLKAFFSGSTTTFYINGTQVCTYGSAGNQSSTKYGFSFRKATVPQSTFDNFKVTAP